MCDTELQEQNEALVRRTFEELTNQNDEIYQEAYAPEYSWYFPSNNSKPLSREEEHEFVKATWDAFPDLYYRIEELIAKDDRIVVRFTCGGTHKGEWQGTSFHFNNNDLHIFPSCCMALPSLKAYIFHWMDCFWYWMLHLHQIARSWN